MVSSWSSPIVTVPKKAKPRETPQNNCVDYPALKVYRSFVSIEMKRPL